MVTIKIGGDNGQLVFQPNRVTIKSGETVYFVNNTGFPHNVVFDEDNVPVGIDASSISREDLMNARGERFSVRLTVPGTYGFYCEAHVGAGETGEIIVVK